MAGSNKYAEELKKEQQMISRQNPFSNPRRLQEVKSKGEHRTVPFIDKKENADSYFALILNSDYQDMEMEIRGLKYYKEIDPNGKERVITKKRENHYLSDDGAEDLLQELKAHLNSDIKLGVMTREEFLMQQDIIRKFLVSYISNNLYKLGMNTEEKQRKSPTLLVMLLARIRSVYSRSVAGLENERSHGDIKISGDLDYNDRDPYNNRKIEDMKN